MTRDGVEHVLRAAAAIVREHSFVVAGSQAILFPFPNAPAELRVSRELDLYPVLNPDKADLGRDRDADFIRALLRHGMIEAGVLLQRIGLLDAGEYPVQAIVDWARRRAKEAASP